MFIWQCVVSVARLSDYQVTDFLRYESHTLEYIHFFVNEHVLLTYMLPRALVRAFDGDDMVLNDMEGHSLG